MTRSMIALTRKAIRRDICAIGEMLSLSAFLLMASLAFGVSVAPATVKHEFIPGVSTKVDKGVPGSSPVASTGPLGESQKLADGSGDVWIADSIPHPTEHEPEARAFRVDEFDASTGEFVPGQQLDEEGGLSFLGFTGIAIGRGASEGEKYVTAGEGGSEVVGVYGPSDKLQSEWDGAGTPNGSFTQSAGKMVGVLNGVAVDGSRNLETGGDVYVATLGFSGFPSFNVVDVFSPIAGGVEPAKPVGEILGTCKAPGVCSGSEVVPFTDPSGLTVSGFNGDVLVTDAYHTVDVLEPVNGMPGVYSFLFSLAGAPDGPFSNIEATSVDASNGNIYVADGGPRVVDEFSASGQFVGRIVGAPAGTEGQTSPFSSVQSVAVDSSTQNVFVSIQNEVTNVNSVDVFGGDLVIPDVVSEAPSEVTPHGAQLNGKVNPDGEGEASCQFVWGTTKAFGSQLSCEPEKVANGSSLAGVHAKLEGLSSDTTYCYRLQATNKLGTNFGEEFQDQCFTTPGPGLHGESVSDVSSTSATLQATIDPNGDNTSYYFQYGKTSEYEAQIPLAPGASIGSGKGDVEVVRHEQGLVPDTTYHYRVVAVSEVTPGTSELFFGADQSFGTQRVGAPSILPDNRAWELVSPTEKHGAQLGPIYEAGVTEASASGEGITYIAYTPTEEQAAGYVFGYTQVMAGRGSNGWSSRDISLSRAAASGAAVGFGSEYRSFSNDLSTAIVEPQDEFISLTPESFPLDTENTPYVRHDATCANAPATCFEPLLTETPGYADVPEGTHFGRQRGSSAEFVGASPDQAHVIVDSGVALSSTLTRGSAQLYEWSADRQPEERVQIVSLLPKNEKGEEEPAKGPELGYENTNVRGAVSEDGSRVVWTEFDGGLYMRDTANGQTVRLDTPEAACISSGHCGSEVPVPQFQIASKDGSRVYFTDEQKLTNDSGATHHQPDLYECAMTEVAGELHCDLSDLTPVSDSGERADVQGRVIGISEDGSQVYFTANGVFGNGTSSGAIHGDCELHEHPGAGECNLYAWHDGTVSFIAAVGGEDYPDWDEGGLNHMTARVSPNGEWLAFMSDRPLTGYDNDDAVSGRPDEEVFLYHAPAEGNASLVCASCDPTGARPLGTVYGKAYEKINDGLVGGDRVWPDTQWIAANVPGWTPYRLGDALYQSRYLSDEGRLFFNSDDALVPQDVNHNEDVYEYEPTGVGDCSSSSVTFGERSSGCVSLISSGTAAGESAFLDASETGDDVFFLTGEKLVSQDVDTTIDLYDAHMCSAGSPCYSAPVVPPACTTADACRTAPEPQPAIFGDPSSSTFSGKGNVISPVVVPAVKAKSLTRAQKLARALSACHKKKTKRKRMVCERQARKQYGKQSGSAKSTKRGKR